MFSCTQHYNNVSVCINVYICTYKGKLIDIDIYQIPNKTLSLNRKFQERTKATLICQGRDLTKVRKCRN